MPLSWADLGDLGAGLTPAEADAYLRGSVSDSRRDAPYRILLELHPELKEVLDPKVQRWIGDAAGELIDSVELTRSKDKSTRAPHHFVAKLSVEIEPHPARELDHIFHTARAPGHGAWFATRVPGKAWRPARRGTSDVCVVFYRTQAGSFDAVAAEIEEHQFDRPDDTTVDALYPPDPEYKGWWRLVKPVRGRLDDLTQITGRSHTGGKTAAEAFKGHLSFAYWHFPASAANGLMLLPDPQAPKQLPP
jgi:hypothetical protein